MLFFDLPQAAGLRIEPFEPGKSLFPQTPLESTSDGIGRNGSRRA